MSTLVDPNPVVAISTPIEVVEETMASGPMVEKKAEVAPVSSAPPSFAKKKKLNKADFMFKAQQDQLLVKRPGDINGIDFMIKDLENCTVVLLDHCAQIQVDRCKNTKFFIGPVKASIFLRDCEDCEVTVACA